MDQATLTALQNQIDLAVGTNQPLRQLLTGVFEMLHLTEQAQQTTNQNITNIQGSQAQPPTINVAPPIVNVPAPVVNLPAPVVNLAAPFGGQQARSDPKVPKPAPYKGERGVAAKFFIQSLELYFSMRPNDFPSAQAKIKYALLLLEDKAKTWGQPIMDEVLHPGAIGTARSTTWTSFKEAFNSVFGDPDEKRTASTKIHHLRQIRGVDEYATEFQQLVAILEWEDDQQLIDRFYQGLKDHVKDALVHYPDPHRLDDFIALTIRLDRRHFERINEKKNSATLAPTRTPTQTRTPTLPPRNNPPQFPPRNNNPQPYRNNNPFVGQTLQTPRGNQPGATAPRNNDPTPMDLSANRGKITPEVRAERLRNRLCLYCGQAGHQAKDHYVRSIAANGETYDYHVADYEQVIAAVESQQVQPASNTETIAQQEQKEASKNPFHVRS